MREHVAKFRDAPGNLVRTCRRFELLPQFKNDWMRALRKPCLPNTTRAAGNARPNRVHTSIQERFRVALRVTPHGRRPGRDPRLSSSTEKQKCRDCPLQIAVLASARWGMDQGQISQHLRPRTREDPG